MMAVKCPIISVDPFSKPQRSRVSTRRRKDYFKPLHVDCSVEYELPNSAKPPIGNKNEPLLMIHPSYYRREESKRRSQFVNNLPKRRISNHRYARNVVNCDVENANRYGTDNYSSAKQKMNDASSLSKVSVPSEIFRTQADEFDFPCSQPRTRAYFRNKYLDSLRPRTSVQGLPMKIIADESTPMGKRVQTNSSIGSTSNVDYLTVVLPAPKLAVAPNPVPVPESISTQPYDSWTTINFQNPNIVDNKVESNDKFINQTQDGSKRLNCGDGLQTELMMPNSISNATATNFNLPTYHQRQPAVGVAAIAATSWNPASNCHDHSSLYPATEGDRLPLMHQQPWSATTAPEFTHSPLPVSHATTRSSLMRPIHPDMPPQYLSARKRTSDYLRKTEKYYSHLTKRTRTSLQEKNQTCLSRSLVMKEQDSCKMYQMDESRNYYHSIAENSGATSCNNLNTLQLFRL